MEPNEEKLRLDIAAQIQYEMMPLCVCPDCGNELEGSLAQQAINVVLRGVTIRE